MADDPKLIEAVARALDPTAWIPADATTEQVKFCRRGHRRNAAKRKAYRLLAAINASETHWLVEHRKIDAIANEFIDVPPQDEPNPLGFHAGWEFCARAFHGALRTAYLAKTETT